MTAPLPKHTLHHNRRPARQIRPREHGSWDRLTEPADLSGAQAALPVPVVVELSEAEGERLFLDALLVQQAQAQDKALADEIERFRRALP